jgi:hypothetical protein
MKEKLDRKTAAPSSAVPRLDGKTEGDLPGFFGPSIIGERRPQSSFLNSRS